MMQEGTFQSIFVLSTSISLSDYDSITLNIGVIRYNDQQLKKEKQQLFKLWKNKHF